MWTRIQEFTIWYQFAVESHDVKQRSSLSPLYWRCVKIKPGRIKAVCAYGNLEDPNRCIVRIYEKYVSVCPKVNRSSAFTCIWRPQWRFVVQASGNRQDRTVWRGCQNLSWKGCFTGYRTNHSLRASATTRLLQAGVDEPIICDVTGHHSNAVRRYKHPRLEMRVTVSSIVGSTTRPTYPAPTATLTRATVNTTASNTGTTDQTVSVTVNVNMKWFETVLRDDTCISVTANVHSFRGIPIHAWM